jgi:hypothetical protein
MRFAAKVCALVGLVVALPFTALPAVAAETGTVEVSISEVNLDGPAISPVTVTVTNDGSAPLSRLAVTFSGPVGWTVYPESSKVKEAVRPGQSVAVAFQIRVPEKRNAFALRTFTATATYSGGDGAGVATGTRIQKSGTPLPSLAAAYNNVGVSDESDPSKGDFDGGGNSFSAQRLAAVGVTPGSSVTALGATFTWPDVPTGTKDNVAGGGQTFQLSGKGQKLAFLGSGSSLSAVGTVTVWYTDGTSSTGSVGFPNWSFQDADAFGATLVIATDGRNTPGGYANAEYKYRVFANSIPLDSTKTVELVTLPSTGSLHIFDLAIVG